jgi:pimeloyl-ACP methyl ester carboxylesterase
MISLPFLARLSLSRLSPHARTALKQAVRDAPKHTAAKQLELLRNFKLDRARLGQITQPVLTIGSQRDRLLPSVREAHHLAKVFPNARRIILPDSGHACLVEAELDLAVIMQANHLM